MVTQRVPFGELFLRPCCGLLECYWEICDALQTRDPATKHRLVDIVEEFQSLVTYLPHAMLESRSVLLSQIVDNVSA